MDWKEHQLKTKGKKHTPLLEEALAFAQKGHALDFGAGALRDSHYLADQGWEVTALDAYFPFSPCKHLNHVIQTFESFRYPQCRYTIVNAIHSLPFVKKSSYNRIWRQLYRSLTPGGVLVATLFGDKDGWKGKKDVLTFTKEEVDTMLRFYNVLRFEEKEYDKKSVAGTHKHWHVYSFIAQK